MNKYKGTIVLESLIDERMINDFEFFNFRVSMPIFGQGTMWWQFFQEKL